MKVLFAHQTHPVEPLGIGYLSSSIAREGHKTRLEVTPADIVKAAHQVSKAIQDYRPDIFAQSIIFGSHGYGIELNKRIKSRHPNLVSILGGPAATFTPELLERGFDAICRYEGEDPFLEFCSALQSGKDVGNIPNMWVKENPKLLKTQIKNTKNILDTNDPGYSFDSGYDPNKKRFVNATRNLLEGEALNRIPSPDREPTYSHEIYRDSPIKHFMHTRGCAFHCAYCHVEMMNIENRGKGSAVRRRSNEKVAEEVSQVMKQYGGELAYYQDDIFGPAYKLEDAIAYAEVFSKLGYPSHAHVRFDLIAKDEGIAKALADGGITGVHVAIEAGDDYIRNEVHKRGMSKKQVLQGAEYLHKYGIKMMTQNILGAPGETKEQMLKTLELNRAVKPTFASASIFQPYPGTSELEYARDNGHLPTMDQDKLIDMFGLDSFYSGSILALDPKEKRWLEVFHKFFAIAVDDPQMYKSGALEKRMEPYLNGEYEGEELGKRYRAHRAEKDEELYGVKLENVVK
jgi:anaerobic magnesium-protoporphyrin IX monomethyl ester cyclase